MNAALVASSSSPLAEQDAGLLVRIYVCICIYYLSIYNICIHVSNVDPFRCWAQTLRYAHGGGKSLAREKVRKEFNKKTGLTALTDEV